MAVMADRYSYISYIGLLFTGIFFVQELIKRLPALKLFILVLITCFTLALAYLCNKRTEVWRNSESLFTDAIRQYGDEASLFYKGLGDYYMDNNMPDKALANYAHWTRLNNDPEVFNDMGNIYKAKKDYPDAARYYLKLLYSGGNIATTFIKVSDVYATAGEYDSAVNYYRKALEINPQLEKLYSEMGTTLTNAGQYQNAINHYNVLVIAHPENPYYYFYRGVAKFSDKQIRESINDFTMPLKLNAGIDVQASAAYNLSIAYDKLGDAPAAFRYAEMAKKAGQKIDSAFFNSLERKRDSSLSVSR